MEALGATLGLGNVALIPITQLLITNSGQYKHYILILNSQYN